ncbi:MAG: beta-lactamase family protein, partial [Pirellulaceae bacterium]|nr:beta-lactamase family protein [Pirellulaceae bacterium]
TVKQLLNHTSGITPEATGARNQGPWQHVLGHDGDPLTAKLAFDPGTKCGYSSFALYHARPGHHPPNRQQRKLGLRAIPALGV